MRPLAKRGRKGARNDGEAPGERKQRGKKRRGGGGENDREARGSVGWPLEFLCLVYGPLHQTDKKRRASRPTVPRLRVGWWSLREETNGMREAAVDRAEEAGGAGAWA